MMPGAAGWYQDPNAPTFERWWDGRQWTKQARLRSDQSPRPASTVPSSDISDGPKEGQASVSRGSAGEECKDLSPLGEAERLGAELRRLRAEIVEVSDLVLLQEVGLYRYSHPLDNAVAYEAALEKLQAEIATLVKGGGAISCAKKWAVNGSEVDGGKLMRDLAKLMLRAYNTEADSVIRTLRPYSLAAAETRLEKLRGSIAKLGANMQLAITDEYHMLRLRELRLTSDFLAKSAEEKEREREERARLREEAAAQRELEAERARLEKERQQYETALNALTMRGDSAGIASTAEKLAEIQSALQGVVEREANVRAGYVYVISNVGSFGDGVVKIGMTRRVDPTERVRELGDASVPFRFDVHAIVFSHDAVALETALHREFADRRINLVNLHREYFRVSATEVKTAMQRLHGHLLTFVEAVEALEWHQSQNARAMGASTGAEP
ncbi:MAG: DUF4041 domain-containing protein [Planctomycetes bacterium]|nr:DUF4041 domain-containing protein [Planctomycetota bacterium]